MAPESRTILEDLALVICVASMVSLIFQRLRLPVALGYLLAGLIVGPHVPIPLFADLHRVELLAELGVILVMFSIGLEFRVDDLRKAIPTAGIAGIVQISGLLWLGYSLGHVLGWSTQESLFLGGMVAVSSTMIVARLIPATEGDSSFADAAYGLLVVQDLVAILLIAVFTSLANGADLPLADLAVLVGKLVGFMVIAMGAGLLVIPRLIREADRKKDSEVLLMAAIGVCFGLALLAHELGYSVALGAFLAGALIAESGKRRQVETLVAPVRDLFASVFFVSIGMLVKPSALMEVWHLIAGVSAMVMFSHLLLTSLGILLSGKSMSTAIRVGLTVGQIGEFAFVIVGIGVAAGVVPDSMMALAVGVAVVTTLTSSVLASMASRIAGEIERRLPRPLQTFVSLYGAWFEGLRQTPRSERRGVRRHLLLLGRDLLLIIAALVGLSFAQAELAARLTLHTGLSMDVSGVLVMVAGLLLLLPFAVGLARGTHRLSAGLAKSVLPKKEGVGVDLAAAPRRVLTVAVDLIVVLLVLFPIIAVSHVFVPFYVTASVLALVVGSVGYTFWKSASNLDGHFQAGAELVLELLNAQRRGDESEVSVESLDHVLPGLGVMEKLVLGAGSPAIGATLATLNLRARTGATVLAIVHPDGRGTSTPTGGEVLEAGDALVLTGSEAAIESARRCFVPGPDDAEGA